MPDLFDHIPRLQTRLLGGGTLCDNPYRGKIRPRKRAQNYRDHKGQNEVKERAGKDSGYTRPDTSLSKSKALWAIRNPGFRLLLRFPFHAVLTVKHTGAAQRQKL